MSDAVDVGDGATSTSAENQKLCQLLLAMSSACSDSEALREAAVACCELFPGVCNVSLAVLSKDAQGLKYYKLNLAPDGTHSYLGVQAPTGTAAGLSSVLKQVVSVSAFENSLPYLDWKRIHDQEGAVSFATAPLLVSEKVLGALSMASTSQGAFNGRVALVEALAAVVAPYLGLQKFRQELKAVEGFLRQMVPMRIALRLTELQSRAFRNQLAAQRQFQPTNIPQQAPPPPPQPQPQPQPQPPVAQPIQPVQEGPQPSQQVPSPSSSLTPNGTRLNLLFTFSNRKLEETYMNFHSGGCQIKLESLFVAFILVTTVVSMVTAVGSSGYLWRLLLSSLLLVLGGFVCELVTREPRKYVSIRETRFIALRLLWMSSYVLKYMLSDHRSCGGEGALGKKSVLEVATCSGALSLFLHGVMAPVRMYLHIPIQWLGCVSCAVFMIWYETVGERDMVVALVVILLMGFICPTVVLYVTERRSRSQFMQVLR